VATASRSSASHGVPTRLRLDLPLIACGKCGQKTVREYKVKKKGPHQGSIFYTCPDRELSNFLSCFVMLCSHFLWWFWLKFLICCCNFSGMALDHVTVGTGRKSMLSTSKNLLQRRLRRLMRVHLCMMRQWTSRRMICLAKACGNCGQKTVREYRVKKKGPNQGCIFYTCPDREVSYFFVIFCYGL